MCLLETPHLTAFKTFTHMHSSFLNSTRLQNRAEEPGAAGGAVPDGAETKEALKSRCRTAGTPSSRVASWGIRWAGGAPARNAQRGKPAELSSSPNVQRLETLGRAPRPHQRPKLWWSGGHTSNPAKTKAAAVPHSPARPCKPARRELRVFQVRRRQRRPRPRAPAPPRRNPAAPEWARETSVRTRERVLGAPAPLPGYNEWPGPAAAGGWRCAPEPGWGWGRARPGAAAAAAGRRTAAETGEEGRGGGEMDGTPGCPCSVRTNSRRCCFQLLPP